LQDANLDGATGLLGTEFARSDVTGTTLPKDIAEFKTLQVVEETSKNTRTIFLSMVLGCAYSWLTIATTTDARLLANSASSPLPIIGTEIPIAYFYSAAPFILMALYVYLHFYLHHLWELLAELPAIFPDGKRLDQRAYPWLLNGLVRRHFEKLKVRPLMVHLKEWITIFLAWWVVPLTLLGFWLRYLPRHEWLGTWIHVGLIVTSATAAIIFYRSAAITLRGIAPELFRWKTAWRGSRAYQGVGIVLIGLVLSAFSFGAINGIKTSTPDVTDIRTWVPQGFEWLGFSVFADLAKEDVSSKPENYWELPSKDRDRSVKGASLARRNLRYANAHRVFLVNADLVDADLGGAVLVGADLRGANLTSAALDRADLSFANLEGARLNYAILENARLRGAKLQGAKLLGAIVTAKELDGACGNEETELPPHLSLKSCPDE
jgi:hypothetical protein